MAQSAAGQSQRPPQQTNDLPSGQSIKGIDFHARQQSGNNFERRVFRGRSNEDNVAVFYIRKKGILLRLIKAMDFIHEEERPAPEAAGLFGIGHYGLDLFNATQDGAKRDEIGAAALGDQAGQGSFAGTGRSP